MLCTILTEIYFHLSLSWTCLDITIEQKGKYDKLG